MSAKESEQRLCFQKVYTSAGFALVPDLEVDRKALEAISTNEKVRVIIKQWRNLDRLRSYWVLLQECVDACKLDMPKETLSQVCKLETGYVDLVKLPNGDIVKLPRSISFEKMNEDDFISFYRATEEFLAMTYGFVREDGEVSENK